MIKRRRTTTTNSRDPAELAKTDIAEHALQALRASTIRRVVVVGRRGHVQVRFACVRACVRVCGAIFQFIGYLRCHFYSVHAYVGAHVPNALPAAAAAAAAAVPTLMMPSSSSTLARVPTHAHTHVRARTAET
jgi:hypothetical protein